VEFRSELENIMLAEELNFEPTPGFGKYRSVMPPEAVAHPAKFNTNLVEFLILRYTKPGDVVLDPMAGTGVLGVIAALHGRNAVQVELEKRFYEWMEKARENVERYPSLTRKGWIVNVLGDARRLSELLSRAGFEPAAVVTSPPYSEGEFDYRHGLKELGPNFRGRRAWEERREIPLRDDNIARLSHGSIDAVVTSPPYGESYLGGGDPERRRERLIKAGYDPKDFLGGRARNAILKHYDEVDAVITSPPYSDVDNVKENSEEFWRKAREEGRRWGSKPPAGTGEKQTSPENIANLPLGEVDAVITSPPYLRSAESGAGVNRQREGDVRIGCSTVGRTVEHPDAIDNVRDYGSIEALARGLMTRDGKPTYLSEMLKVYAQMFKVLKPGGLAIVVVKPFQRNRKVVDLPYHTCLLMSRVGFRLEKLYKLRLKSQSFWRILYYRKNPDVPRIVHEYVIVARKD